MEVTKWTDCFCFIEVNSKLIMEGNLYPTKLNTITWYNWNNIRFFYFLFFIYSYLSFIPITISFTASHEFLSSKLHWCLAFPCTSVKKMRKERNHVDFLFRSIRWRTRRGHQWSHLSFSGRHILDAHVICKCLMFV